MSVAAIFQLETPFTEDHLRVLRYEQTGDGVVLTVQGVPPQLLQRFDHDDWRLNDAPIGVAAVKPVSVAAVATVNHSDTVNGGYTEQDYQYGVSAIDDETGRESEVTDTAVIQNDLGTRPGAPDGNYNTITPDAVVGAREYRVYRKKNGSYGYVGTLLPPTTAFIDDNILPDFADGPPRNYDPFSDGEYPSCVTFHNRRTFFARTLTRPSTVFGSQTDDLFNFDKSRPLRATDSIEANLLGRGINAVRHLVSLGALIALTGDGILTLGSESGVLTPTTIESKTQGYRGVGNARPALVDEVGFYTTARGQSIRTLGYSFERDGYRGNDLTVFARHFFTGQEVIELAWCEQPSSVLWCLRADGKLAALTWLAEQDVWGWSLCDTDGIVESICPVSEDGRDVLYAAVQRTIAGESRRYIERLTDPKWIEESWTSQEEAVVMDCSATYVGNPTKVITGLWWLEGKAVSVLADGYVQEGHSVVNGRLTPDLPETASRVSIGLPYVSYIRTLPVVGNTQGGSTKGRPQSVSSVVAEVLNSRGLVMGAGSDPELTRLYDAPFPSVSTTPRPLYSGLLDTMGMDGQDWRSAKVTIAQLKPLPMVVLGVFPDISVS